MKSLFRSFDRFGLEYLLIGGQASILYGAATFSEDIDLWGRPVASNLPRLLRALAARARVYKLTPPLMVRNAREGHAFHFFLPSGAFPVFLDVLGCPPRVGSFGGAVRRARIMSTGWGQIPVVSLPDLIELKKTRRLSAYEVISNLVRLRVSEAPVPSRTLLVWAARHTFCAEDRVEYLRRLGVRASLPECRRRLALEIQRCQARDMAYWRPLLRRLRELRRRGALLPEGLPVARLLG